MALFVRDLTAVERSTIERLVRAETAPVRLVRRARIVQRSALGMTVPMIARDLGVGEATVRAWIRRFDTAGIAGLDDAPRVGRPRTFTEAQRGQVIAKARQRPAQAEGEDVPPTCHWTLDRLEAELHKEGLPIKRSQIRRILHAEHLKWQRPRTWLESDDPAFAEKRGPSSPATPTRPQAAQSSV
jgi:transposase